MAVYVTDATECTWINETNRTYGRSKSIRRSKHKIRMTRRNKKALTSESDIHVG